MQQLEAKEYIGNMNQKLKKWDAELYSVVGAAGELFAVRTELFQEVERIHCLMILLSHCVLP